MDEAVLQTLAEDVAGRIGGSRRRILFITGAGISVESGLPTYRGIGGLYADAQTEHGMPIERALSGPVFRRHPEITWHHIARLEAAVRGARPNRAHDLIAALESRHEVVVLTQNVDGLHRAAGSTRVIDIHGDCHDLRCTRCEHRERRDTYEAMEVPPKCPGCGAVIRPEVVLFEELLPPAKVRQLAAELERGFDAYFSVGTSSLFPYITQPMVEAARAGLLTIEINPSPTPLAAIVDTHFPCGTSRALNAIFPLT